MSAIRASAPDLKRVRDDMKPRGIRPPAGFARVFPLAAWLFTCVLPPASAHGATYVVDNGSANCSDAGPGTESQPYCTIGAAVAAHNGVGTTIEVKAGVYREQVMVPSSGTAGSPFVLEAQGQVVVEGADRYAAAGQWTAATGTEWVAAGVTWSPVQVVVDGVRLTASGSGPGTLAVNTFRWETGSGLYVNLGGDNPGTHETEVGRRANGFLVIGRSFVTIEGFTVQRSEDRGIQLRNGCTNVALRHNRVTQSGRHGIQAVGGSALAIEDNTVWDNGDHGIGLLTGVSGSTVVGNESYGNGRVGGAATGIYVFGCAGNLIASNRVHDNQDSGLQLQGGSNDCVSLQNRSWGNGDHGYHVNSSTGTVRVGDVAYGNRREGFLFESGSSGSQLHDCIGVDNGLVTGEYDLWVDGSSASGLDADRNLWWNSTGQAVVKYGVTPYTTLAGYQAASGQEGRSLQADPRFVAAAAGDFHVEAGSPAIDAADAGVASWPASDAEGSPRVDDPATVNSGLGVVSYADLGALEYQPGTPPTAVLTVAPSSGTAPLTVTADGSGSSDDGAVVSYRFDFGDGTVVGPQAEATASHSYGAGDWAVTLTVTDDQGLTGSATCAAIHVAPLNQPPEGTITQPAGNVTIYAGQSVSFAASASDPDGDLPLMVTWDFGGGAANQSVEDPGPVIFANAGSYTVRLRVSDARGAEDVTPAERVVTVRAAPQGQAVDEVHWTIVGQRAVSFDWRGFERTVHYGLSSDYSDSVTASTPDPLPVSSAGPFWEARIEGLQENTLYHYAIGSGADHTFRTPLPRGSSGFTVYAEGDIGDAGKYPRVAVVQGLIAAGAPRFTLVLGDITYAQDNGQASVDRHFNDVMVWSQDAAYMPAWGNHDWGAPDVLRNYKGRFDLPNPQASPDQPFGNGSGEDWSWFDYGNVRFISYPEVYTGRVWPDWKNRAKALMDQAEADPLITFIVTFGHRPAYSSGRHPSNAILQAILDTLGAHHPKYVLNVNGHSHNYERSYPQFGVTHITSGGGGSVLGKAIDPVCLWVGGCPPPAWSAFRAMHHETVRLTFTATGIQGEAICGPAGDTGSNPNDVSCTLGEVLDTFSIGSAPPTSANLVGNPSVEAGLSGWKGYNGALLERVGGGADGDWAMQLTSTLPGRFGVNDSPNWVALVPAAGTKYRLTARVRSEGGTGTACIQVREFVGATRAGASLSAPVPLTTTWQTLTTEFVASAAGSTLDFQVLDSPAAPGETFLVDDLSIRLVTESGPVAVEPRVRDLDESGLETAPLRAMVRPSPVRSRALLTFTTSRRGPLEVVVYDAAGRRVEQMLNERDASVGPYQLEVGHHSGLSSGIYFYKIRAGKNVATGRFVIVQ